MSIDFMFFVHSLLLGVGLEMDAFAVSVANGVQDPGMKNRKVLLIAGTFGIFQGLMPLIGWFFVNVAADQFSVFEKIIPFISLILLVFIGSKMVKEGLAGNDEAVAIAGFGALMVQGIATSIDALSVGFTIADYTLLAAALCAVIITLVTLIFCLFALKLGNKIGSRFSDKATVVGGIILIILGIEIFVTGMFL